SEIAVAISVSSLDVKPACSASIRPAWRADTRSMSDSMRTRTLCWRASWLVSFVTSHHNHSRFRFDVIKKRQAFLEVQRRRDIGECYPQLDHRKCDIGLYAHDDRMRAAQSDHVGQVSKRSRSERIEHIQCGDIDNDTARPEPA